MTILSRYLVSATQCLDKGINSGLSVGLQFKDNPPVTYKMRDGNKEKPDQMIYNAVQVVEVSLTPLPKISNAGILSRITDKMGENSDNNESDDE